jgi:hypothetical protein
VGDLRQGRPGNAVWRAICPRSRSIEALFGAASRPAGGDLGFNVARTCAPCPPDTDIVDINLDVWDRVMTVSVDHRSVLNVDGCTVQH